MKDLKHRRMFSIKMDCYGLVLYKDGLLWIVAAKMDCYGLLLYKDVLL